VNLREFTTAQHWEASWPHGLDQTDLIVDFADNAPTIRQLGPALDPAFRNLHHQRKWRTVTTAGTSMPENFGGYAQGVHTIDRAELLIWEQLLQLHLPYRLDYGDYATLSTTPAPSGIKWGYPINVRYTLRKEFLICRGVATTGPDGVDLDEQLIAHAKAIVRYPDRHPIACWADATIDRIAVVDERPGNLEYWVKIGVNRHIEWVRSNLP
jgi:T4 beta protein